MRKRRDSRYQSSDSSDDFVPGSSPMSLGASPRAPRLPAQRPPAIVPRNAAQKRLIDMLEGQQAVVVAIGSAGTGKTVCATIMGAAKLHSGEVSRIVITRAAVTGEESLGHLPGTLENKVLPFLMPIYDALNGVFGAPAVRDMVDDKVIEVAPLAYMRGRTFNDAWIILDEASSCTPNQMLMILTRVGHNSKLIITGDLEQSDLKGRNGLQDLMERLSRGNYPEIGVCRFGPGDVVRHPIVATVLKMYAEPVPSDRADRTDRADRKEKPCPPVPEATVTRGTAVIQSEPVVKTFGFVTEFTKVITAKVEVP